ncbi:MAG: sigma-54-dependent Fis family transcriptional regulator, partial [Planctomycetes bacterium]|nr:sigma-54-dependent Fis family transcriptional regulator [Planctomycetota bacterium]
DLQVKLLRVLQDGRFERVGGETTLSVDVRVVATAKARLEDLVAAGKFRQDLCYRLKVIEISLPPLRERREDLPLLTRHFLDEEARRSGSPRRDLSPDAMGALLSARWPGNVRELQHAIQHACALGTAGTIERLHLPLPVEEGAPGGSVVHLCLDGVSHLDLPGTVEEVEKRLTRWALAKCAGHQGRAAEMLGLPRTTFRERLARAESGPAQ